MPLDSFVPGSGPGQAQSLSKDGLVPAFTGMTSYAKVSEGGNLALASSPLGNPGGMRLGDPLHSSESAKCAGHSPHTLTNLETLSPCPISVT